MNAKIRELQRNGPFPEEIDPWAERGHYFHQLHAQMIGYLVDQLTDGLYELGYVVGRESSLQITSSLPDLFVNEISHHPAKLQPYPQMLATLALEEGQSLAQSALDLDRLFVQSLETGDLVTVVEFVSPNNKIRQKDIESYQERRAELMAKGVNVVEIDLTRSYKRLLDDPITDSYPYHIVIYPCQQAPYFLGMRLHDAPKTFALPLRDKAYPAELNSVYRQAYSKLLIAAQIQKAGDYSQEALPFPSLLSETERNAAFETVKSWQAQLQNN